MGSIHLTSPSGHCLAVEFSQFVFEGLKRKVLLSHFGQAPDLSSTWTVSWDEGTSNTNQVSPTWMIFHWLRWILSHLPSINLRIIFYSWLTDTELSVFSDQSVWEHHCIFRHTKVTLDLWLEDKGSTKSCVTLTCAHQWHSRGFHTLHPKILKQQIAFITPIKLQTWNPGQRDTLSPDWQGLKVER